MDEDILTDNLVNYFDGLESLNESEKGLLKQHLKPIRLKKGNHFLANGAKSDKIGFVVKGILRLYEYNSDGKEITHCFIKENGFITDLTSFYNQTNSSKYIIAETNCSIIYFSYSSYILFSKEITKWHQIIHKASEKTMSSKITEKTTIIVEDGLSRYLNFINNHPDIANRVALKSIANYLGLTKHSVSRIRKIIAQNDLLPLGNSKK
ncbi:MAG TPA: Crp/Fnr family transcriptional regulator [Cyclobacteriaceae bacterium]|nr:Crp/Fnr family transcriptional regulator [Cyclobacteriaceae bacterium]HRJ83775.1 Crp/Fnr family transcriptional regulator [Cyclobacteriaceae bacterium]